MAKFTIDKVLHFGVSDLHDATDWQVALDEDFNVIIDESIGDKVNLLLWHTPLPKIGGKGYYSDQDIIYARARIWHGDVPSNWIVLNDNQNFQVVKITQEYMESYLTDSDKIDMQ